MKYYVIWITGLRSTVEFLLRWFAKYYAICLAKYYAIIQWFTKYNTICVRIVCKLLHYLGYDCLRGLLCYTKYSNVWVNMVCDKTQKSQDTLMIKSMINYLQTYTNIFRMKLKVHGCIVTASVKAMVLKIFFGIRCRICLTRFHVKLFIVWKLTGVSANYDRSFFSKVWCWNIHIWFQDNINYFRWYCLACIVPVKRILVKDSELIEKSNNYI